MHVKVMEGGKEREMEEMEGKRRRENGMERNWKEKEVRKAE